MNNVNPVIASFLAPFAPKPDRSKDLAELAKCRHPNQTPKLTHCCDCGKKLNPTGDRS